MHNFFEGLVDSGNIFWIGVSDIASHGTYVFANGQPVTNPFWDSTEPGGGSEHYAAMYESNGKWRDFSGSEEFYYLCKRGTQIKSRKLKG